MTAPHIPRLRSSLPAGAAGLVFGECERTRHGHVGTRTPDAGYGNAPETWSTRAGHADRVGIGRTGPA